MCSWPKGSRKPSIPLPYAQESMTGFEYALASLMIQAGLNEEAPLCVRAVRDRYDGEKRNPWNEIECGSNYARSMASYSLLNAYSGFQFDLTRQYIGFFPQSLPFRCFWALDPAWGEIEIGSGQATLHVHSGEISLREVALPFVVAAVHASRGRVGFTATNRAACFNSILTVREGETL